MHDATVWLQRVYERKELEMRRVSDMYYVSAVQMYLYRFTVLQTA